MGPQLQELIPKIREGDAAAFRDLFFAAKDPLFGYACKLCRSRELAEEVVQEVFMKLWINRRGLDQQQSVKAYLYTATRNCVFNLLKKAALDHALKQAVFLGQPQAVNTTEEDISMAELLRLKASILEQLPPQRRLIYSLSRIDGLSHDEIAARLGISRNTVKDQIVKASRFLRTRLHDYQDVIVPLLVMITFDVAAGS